MITIINGLTLLLVFGVWLWLGIYVSRERDPRDGYNKPPKDKTNKNP